MGFFATPVIYPISIFPTDLQGLVMLNPVARVLTMLRNCTLYQISPTTGEMAYLTFSAIVVLLLGYFIFERLEPKFAEAI